MKHCPAPDCSYRVKHGSPAEFIDSIEVCSDCGAPLNEGAAPAASSTAQVPGRGQAAVRGSLPAATGRALAVTLLAAVVAAAGHLLPLPFINIGALGLGSGGGVEGLLNIVPTQLSLFALGVGPWLTSFMVVEVTAVAVPALRPLRLRPAGRRTLNKASVSLGLVIAAFQAWMLLGWLRSMTTYFADEPLLTDGLNGGLVGAMLVGVSFGLVLLAGAVGGRGSLAASAP